MESFGITLGHGLLLLIILSCALDNESWLYSKHVWCKKTHLSEQQWKTVIALACAYKTIEFRCSSYTGQPSPLVNMQKKCAMKEVFSEQPKMLIQLITDD